MPDPSPFKPTDYPDPRAVPGVELAACNCGIRYKKRPDLMLAVLAEGSTVAGVYTRSLTASAPVEWCREAQKQGKVRAIVVNSGNSNAFTGSAGVKSVQNVVDFTASLLGCPKNQVLMASTGVIGEPLRDNLITGALPGLHENLSSSSWYDAAHAIMTTDTFAKLSSRQLDIGSHQITITGIAKGSGMIAPNMGTMLGFIFTDAKISSNVLQAMCVEASDESFNSITVDGDTSTSDTVILAATGIAGNREITDINSDDAKEFLAYLKEVMTDLALQIVKDGEGITKMITINVTGAVSSESARKIGLTIANSPLVKTAVAGEDPNWGRVVAAAGRAGEPLNQNKLAISMGGVQIALNGMVVSGYDETPVKKHFKGNHVIIDIDVGVGSHKATVYTCDLTHGYIDINASYRS